jgi:plasmid segregation protein ParM
MMMNPNRLPDGVTQVATRSLSEGTLFVAADGTIYQVVLAGSAGFRKAKRWGGTEQEAVALVPDSPLAYHYPVVEYGTPLPRPKRADLTDPDGEASHFVFPEENLARAAAFLDETLAWQAGCMARHENDRWFLTDGLHQFRVYHYEKAEDGKPVDLVTRFEKENIQANPHTGGPAYWSFLPQATSPTPPPTTTTEPTTAPEPATTRQPPTAPEPSMPAPTLMPPEKPVRASAQKGKNMILSIDIGYGYTKGIGPDGLRFSFPSVIGTAEEIAFTSDLIADAPGPAIQYDDRRFFYGEQALLQSRLRTAIFDRSRVHDETYRLLFVAALAELPRELTDKTSLNIVTGLPVGFFNDREEVIVSLAGEYQLEMDEAVTFDVQQVFVVPQPFGSLFRELLNKDGVISNLDVEHGRVAVIDVGTYTVDFVMADELRYVQRFSTSISTGWSEVVSSVQRALSNRYRLELSLHEVDKAMRSGGPRIKGQPIDIEPLLKPALRDLQMAIVAKARDLWGEGAMLDVILITGGAAEHMAHAIQALYPQARLVPDAFWANAEGFYRFGQRPATFGEA